jgi:hypothetical protein
MYKLIKSIDGLNVAVFRQNDNTSFVFVPANTDYANFKKEVLAGAELQDADGNTMTTEEATEFVGTLP